MFVDIVEAMDYIKDMFDVNAGTLGLNYVGYGDERVITKYPAVVVDSGPTEREIHGTHKFKNTFHIVFWVYHAGMNLTYQRRTQEDLLLVREITNLLHSDLTLGGNIVFGYIDSSIPGLFQRPKGSAVVGTRMTWEGYVLESFM
jgi:hypothetical protein